MWLPSMALTARRGFVRAIDRLVAALRVALGLPQLLALAEPENGTVAFSEYSRTPKARVVAVRTMRE